MAPTSTEIGTQDKSQNLSRNFELKKRISMLNAKVDKLQNEVLKNSKSSVVYLFAYFEVSCLIVLSEFLSIFIKLLENLFENLFRSLLNHFEFIYLQKAKKIALLSLPLRRHAMPLQLDHAPFLCPLLWGGKGIFPDYFFLVSVFLLFLKFFSFQISIVGDQSSIMVYNMTHMGTTLKSAGGAYI